MKKKKSPTWESLVEKVMYFGDMITAYISKVIVS